MDTCRKQIKYIACGEEHTVLLLEVFYTCTCTLVLINGKLITLIHLHSALYYYPLLLISKIHVHVHVYLNSTVQYSTAPVKFICYFFCTPAFNIHA